MSFAERAEFPMGLISSRCNARGANGFGNSFPHCAFGSSFPCSLFFNAHKKISIPNNLQLYAVSQMLGKSMTLLLPQFRQIVIVGCRTLHFCENLSSKSFGFARRIICIITRLASVLCISLERHKPLGRPAQEHSEDCAQEMRS